MGEKKLKYPSKAKFLQAPPMLGRAIEAINLLTSEADQKYEEIDLWELGLTDDWANFYDALPKAVRKFVAELSEEKDFSRPPTEDDYLSLFDGFQNLLFFRNVLASLRATHEKAATESNGDLRKYKEMMITEFHRLINPDTNKFGKKYVVKSLKEDGIRRFDNLVIDFSPDSVFDFEPRPIVGILKKVEFRRVRECLRCKRLFWAKRLDAYGCSTPCSAALRQKKLREAKKDANQ